MSLLFHGPKGSAEHRWIDYALLRDNVQHHLEGGSPAGAFTHLHAVADALGGRVVSLPAAEIHAELDRARALLTRPVSELAISTRTHAVVSYAWPPPAEQRTRLVKDESTPLPSLTGRETTLADVFGSLLDDLMRITDGAAAGQQLTVTDH